MGIRAHYGVDANLLGDVTYGSGYLRGANARRDTLEQRALLEKQQADSQAFKERLLEMQHQQSLERLDRQAQISRESQDRAAILGAAARERGFDLGQESAENEFAKRQQLQSQAETARMTAQDDQQAHALSAMDHQMQLSQQAADQAMERKREELSRLSESQKRERAERRSEYERLQAQIRNEASKKGYSDRMVGQALSALDANPRFADVASPLDAMALQQDAEDKGLWVAPTGERVTAPRGKDGQPDIALAEENWHKRQQETRKMDIEEMRIQAESTKAMAAARAKEYAEIAKARLEDVNASRKAKDQAPLVGTEKNAFLQREQASLQAAAEANEAEAAQQQLEQEFTRMFQHAYNPADTTVQKKNRVVDYINRMHGDASPAEKVQLASQFLEWAESRR